MRLLLIFSLAISAMLICLIDDGSSQVTFSKGWGPGKRSVYDERFNCKINTQSLITAYYTLLSDLKQLLVCENRRMMPYYAKPEEETNADVNSLMTKR